jgi:hypothetical protein
MRKFLTPLRKLVGRPLTMLPDKPAAVSRICGQALVRRGKFKGDRERCRGPPYIARQDLTRRYKVPALAKQETKLIAAGAIAALGWRLRGAVAAG